MPAAAFGKILNAGGAKEKYQKADHERLISTQVRVQDEHQSHQKGEYMCPTQTGYNAFLVMACQPVRDTKCAIDIFDAWRQVLQILLVQQWVRFRLDAIEKPDRIAAVCTATLKYCLVLFR